MVVKNQPTVSTALKAAIGLEFWWQEARRTLDWAHLGAVVLLLVAGVSGGPAAAGISVSTLARWMEQLMPLLGILLFTNLLCKGGCRESLELAAARGSGVAGIFIRRLIVTYIFICCFIAVAMAVYMNSLPLETLWRTVATALVGGLFFGLLGATAAHRFGSSTSGLSLAASIWACLVLLTVVMPSANAAWRSLAPMPAFLGVVGPTFWWNRAVHTGAVLMLLLLNMRLLKRPARLFLSD